ncbi:MAG: hypothetical protein ACK2T3_09930, partial [Candidatus Promineifilaceae bacterium]
MNAIKRLTFKQKAALAGVIYAILIAILTWPAIRSLGEGLIGNNEDVWIFYWNNWWLKEALSKGYDFFFTPYLFSPLGTSLV